MAKAQKFHSEAPRETYELLEDMIDKHHDSLSGSDFLILFKHGGWFSKGKTLFGKFKVLADDLRSTMKRDAILYLNADMWNRMAEPQRRYVLDHALFTLDLKYDRHGKTKMAADGRPLLTTLPPDIEGFTEVIKRHGAITEDVKRLAKALTETNQLTIEDIAKEEEEKPQDKPAEPREGVKGYIHPDGTIDINDPNQAKLPIDDEAAAAAEIAASAAGGENPDDDLPF
ncbi:putative metallopeptidase [Paenibacillus sp. FSL P2-0322]|uniref:putative metallopeptidase n=1 Tax=Paenibacillus sp. FSL P2-0322 TaxID=2921628 RepID=UPI0030D43ED3